MQVPPGGGRPQGRHCADAGVQQVPAGRGVHERVTGAWACVCAWACVRVRAYARACLHQPTNAPTDAPHRVSLTRGAHNPPRVCLHCCRPSTTSLLPTRSLARWRSWQGPTGACVRACVRITAAQPRPLPTATAAPLAIPLSRAPLTPRPPRARAGCTNGPSKGSTNMVLGPFSSHRVCVCNAAGPSRW